VCSSDLSGTFSPLKLDTGTEILLQHLDLAPLDGNILDLGCGWGPIALNLAKHSPKATIWAVDVNTRSLELTTRNASDLDLINMKIATPDQVPTEIQFSGIWSNPPIRIGKRALHELLLQWLPRLEVAGCAYLVVQKNLGSDSLQRWLEATLESNYQVSRLTSIKTYRILKVKKIN
jgi:16S rRNA G1207 methylase RsmC